MLPGAGHPPVEAVVFDYGGVIAVSPFAQLREAEAVLGLAPGTFSDLLGYGLDIPEPAPGEPYTNKWHLFEIGAIDLEEYADWVVARSRQRLGWELDPRDRMRNGGEGTTIYWEVVHELRRLRHEGLRLGLCTNNIAPYRATWRSQFPVELFDVVVDSCEVRLRKPEPAIYRLTCERLGVAPEATVFLDDHPGNVAGAEAVGMRGIVVGEDVGAALRELRALLDR